MASVAFAFAGIVGPPLTAPDEIRVAEIGREMYTRGDWIVPQLGAEPFLEEPPLYYAAVAASLRLFGESEAAARLPSALSTVLTLLLAFDMARRLVAAGVLGSPACADQLAAQARAGLLAICVLASITGFHIYSHRCMVDSWLTLGVTLGFWAWLRILLQPSARSGPLPAPASLALPGPTAEHASPQPGFLLLLYAAASLAFLVKGPVGVVLLAGPLVIDMLVNRRWWLLHSRVHLTGALLLLAGAALWPLLLWSRGGRELLDGYLVENVLRRIVSGTEEGVGGHGNAAWYYLLKAPVFLLPWSLALPGLVAWLWRSRGVLAADPLQAGARAARSALGSMALVFPIGLALLSIPENKRELYLMPLLVPLAVALAVWLAWTVASGRKSGIRIAGVAFVIALAAQLCAPLLADATRDLRPLAVELRDGNLLGESLAGWCLDERTRSVVPWYTGQIVNNLRDPAQLQEFVKVHPDGRLLVADVAIASLPPAVAERLNRQLHWSFGKQSYGIFTFAPPGERGHGVTVDLER